MIRRGPRQPRDHVVVVGAGLSGSLLVQAVASTSSTRRVLLVDPLEHPTDRRSWAFFQPDEEAPNYDAAVRRFRAVRIAGNRGEQLLRLRQHSYAVLDGCALEGLTDVVLTHVGTRRRGRVEAVDRDHGLVHIDGDAVRARLVLDSVGIDRTDSVPVAWLHFIGWQVRADEPVFDASVATLMDFRVPQHGQLRFAYVLPVSEREALVELTVFSGRAEAPTVVEQDLTEYLDAVVGTHAWHADPAEAGSLPLATFGGQRRWRRGQGSRAATTVQVGAAAHLVKASTGYGARLMERDARMLAVDLARGRVPRGLRRKARHRWLDSVFVRLVVSDPDQARDALERMFSANPVDRVVRFLNEESGLLEEARLIATLPVRPFAKAALRRSPHRRHAHPRSSRD